MPQSSKLIKINSKRACEPCKGKRYSCDSQSSCLQCTEFSKEEHAQERTRSTFPVQELKRLSSACETCRKRKTKCDGGSPCAFCIVNRVECVYSEKKAYGKPEEAIDRIEDRLQRIEKLMAAFSPSYFNQVEGHRVRPHRHSVQGVNSAREKKDLLDRKARGYRSFSSIPARSQSSIDHSMLNLSLSPTVSARVPLTSASSSSASESHQSDGFNSHLPTPSLSSQSDSEFKISIPSVTDQLSEYTFGASSIDYTVTQYPIYPLNTLSGHRNSA
ncbi:hypothetical protein BY458DRAFT_529724 [Sporodiniella umbellata]|nr:hypothetical protein BY458DRAFT_529724 [Sporodiniella umbellata]